jgi:transposase
MPWKEVSPMEQKMQFISLPATCRYSVTQLCEDFEISRKTGHKWLSRYAEQGRVGLKNLSRQPRGCSHQTSEEVVALIIKERKKYRTWGPKKLFAILGDTHGLASPPARSTIASILHRHGLIEKRRRWAEKGINVLFFRLEFSDTSPPSGVAQIAFPMHSG